MLREMLLGKIHRATVTDTRLEYPGSLTVDEDLLEAAGILPHQKVQVVNCHNGTRMETYAILGARGSGEVIVNGAAARWAQPGDLVIIIAYGILDEQEVRGHKPRVVVADARNGIAECL